MNSINTYFRHWLFLDFYRLQIGVCLILLMNLLFWIFYFQNKWLDFHFFSKKKLVSPLNSFIWFQFLKSRFLHSCLWCTLQYDHLDSTIKSNFFQKNNPLMSILKYLTKKLYLPKKHTSLIFVDQKIRPGLDIFNFV